MPPTETMQGTRPEDRHRDDLLLRLRHEATTTTAPALVVERTLREASDVCWRSMSTPSTIQSSKLRVGSSTRSAVSATLASCYYTWAFTQATTSWSGSAGSSNRSGSRPSSNSGWMTLAARCPTISATRSSCTPLTSPVERSSVSHGTMATTDSIPAANASSTRCVPPCRFHSSSNRSRSRHRPRRMDGVTYSESSVTWVDGGLLSNFPVEVFDRSDGQPQRWPTIGIKLSALRHDSAVSTSKRRHAPRSNRLPANAA